MELPTASLLRAAPLAIGSVDTLSAEVHALATGMNETHSIGKYELIALIARGGMGNVYLARTGGLGGFHKLVVVKTLKPELAEDERFRSMFLDEAKLAARLSHRNIVQTNDVGESDGVYYLIMEYLDGRSLAVVSKRAENVGMPLDLTFRVRVLADMLAGLHHAHELADYDGNRLGVVHRDVCPANVLITFDGQVRIVDFGVAKTKNQAHETQAGTIKGRVAYMSPEHVAGRGLDHRADVFSTGIMLWEALTKERFWGSRSEAELLGALVRGELPQLPEDPSIPAELREVCNKALALKPADRFATAHAMRAALEDWLSHQDDREPLETWKTRMVTWFARERAHVAKLIENSTSASTAGGELPVLEPALSASSLPGSHSGATDPRARSRATSPTTLSAPVASINVPADPARPRSRMPLFAGVAALLAVGAVLAWASFGGKPAPSTATTLPTPDPSARLTVQVSPPSAHIFVDGNETSNPFTGAFAINSTHDVRAVAEGHDDKTEHVQLAENTQLRMHLEPRAAASAETPQMGARSGVVASSRNAGARAGSSPQPAAQPTEPAPTKAPARTIDSNNPYAKPDAPAHPARAIDSNNPYGN